MPRALACTASALIATFGWATPALAADPPRPAVIIFGGGWGPDGNQASLEAHVEALSRALAPSKPEVLFGTPSPEHPSVQILAKEKDEPGEILALIFDQRHGVGVEYRKQQLDPAGPATKAALLTTIRLALTSERPVVVFGAGHGTLPENEPALLELWGPPDEALAVDELAQALDASQPKAPIAFVLGQCHSGAFTGVMYAAGDPTAARAKPARCVLAAIPADREASGCTPDLHDPSARSYMALMAEALGDPGLADVDGNRRVSLAEAHAYARINDATIDVPVSSSESWVRARLGAKAPPIGPRKVADVIAKARPIERRVLEKLKPGSAGGEGVKLAKVEEAFAALGERIRRDDEALAEVEDERDRVQRSLRRAVIARWPELVNPYHRDSRRLLAGEAVEVVKLAKSRPELETLRKLDAEIGRRAEALAQLDRDSAKMERWIRAAENVVYEAALKAAKDRAALEEILACEAMEP